MAIVRKTKSVSLLLDMFQRSEHALSVVQLVDNTKEEMNKTTVYRILDRLEKEGVVHSFLGKGGLKWYAKCFDCNSHNHSDLHPHFQCDKCGTIECLPMEIPIPNVSDRKIKSVEIMLQGICPNCLS